MKAYTDEFIVRPDGIYRKEEIYNPGKGWTEEKLIMWLPKPVAMAALALWQEDDGK